MRIAIVGPGGLGLFLAARLSHLAGQKKQCSSGEDSVSLCVLDYNDQRAAQLRENGVWLEQEEGSIHVELEVSTSAVALGICDVIFLCVKVPGVAAALQGLSPMIGPDTVLVGMQNGIKHPELLAGVGGVAALGVTSEGVTLLAPGRVAHRGRGLTRLGLLGNGNKIAIQNLAKLASLLNEAGLHTEVVDSVLRYLWAKLLVNVGVNALTALHDIPNGALLESEELRAIMESAVREAAQVAKALAIEVEGDPVESTIAVCRATGSNISSMLQDVRKGRATEIDAINGAIVQAGKQMDIPTPVNARLTAGVKALEQSYLL